MNVAASKSFPVPSWAASVLECYPVEVSDWEEDADIAAAVRAYKDGKITVTRETWADVAYGLRDLANGEDDMAEAQRHTNPEGKKYARWSRDGLYGLRKRIMAWGAE